MNGPLASFHTQCTATVPHSRASGVPRTRWSMSSGTMYCCRPTCGVEERCEEDEGEEETAVVAPRAARIATSARMVAAAMLSISLVRESRMDQNGERSICWLLSVTKQNGRPCQLVVCVLCMVGLLTSQHGGERPWRNTLKQHTSGARGQRQLAPFSTWPLSTLNHSFVAQSFHPRSTQRSRGCRLQRVTAGPRL